MCVRNTKTNRGNEDFGNKYLGALYVTFTRLMLIQHLDLQLDRQVI